jgi:glycosyltransferase involved in cell wall biosynthesis/O-antigen/teichoic acid export membrane protein
MDLPAVAPAAPAPRRRRIPASFSRTALGFFIAVAIMNASNYAFHVMVSRSLGPGEYGALSSLLAVLLVLSVPLNTLQTTVAKRTAELQGDGRALEIPSLSIAAVRLLGPLALAVCGGLALFAPVVGAFLRVSLMSVALLGVFAFVSIVLAAPLGALQGLLRFRAMAIVMLGGVAIRLVGGFLFVEAGWGMEGALLATTLGPAVSLVLAQRVFLRRRSSDGHLPGSWSVTLLRGQFRETLLGLGAFWVLAGLDVVLARHYLGPEQAGFYACAAIIARALLFLPGAISTIGFPWFVKATRGSHEAAHWLRITLAAVAGLALLSLPPLILLRRSLVTLAFGAGFVPSARLVPVLAISMGVLAIANLLVYFCIAQGVRAHLVMIPGIALQVGLVSAFHGSPQEVTVVLLAVSSLVTVGLWLAARAVARPSAIGGTTTEMDPAVLDTSMAGGGPPPPRLSLVLPCHNGARTLVDVLEQTTDLLSGLCASEVILVSDGSTDETETLARGFADRGVRTIAYPERRGKGHALRIGLTAARGRFIAYMDADGDIAPEALTSFLPLVDLYDPDAVIGSKRHPLSQIDYPAVRRLLSWLFSTLTRVLFRLNVRDTQTGMKLFRRDVLEAVLPRLRDDGYTFDLELLVVAARLGYTRIFEAPVRVGFRSASQIGLRTPFHMAAATAALFLRRYVLDGYRDPRAMPSVGPVDGGSAIDAPLADEREHVSVPRTNPLRILLLNWRDIANPQAGGAEAFTHEVARRWAAWGHEVTLLTSRFPGARPTETIDGVHVRRVGALRRGSFHLLVQRELSRLQGYDVLIDEINTIPFLTPLWSETLPPIVGLIHQLAEDVWDAEMPRPVAAIGRRVEPRMLRMYHDVPVVTISGSTSADLERLGFRDVRVILQGRDEPPEMHVAKESTPTLLFVGRLAANKRPHHAIAAYGAARERVPDAQLWIVGDGVMEEALREQADDGIQLLGHVSRRELYERMARAHCLLVPSVREGWGLVITEANAVGTPAVGYDVPGIRDAIRHERTGLLTKAGDPVELGRSAAELIAHHDRYAQMQIEAVRWGRCFTWDITAELFLEIVLDRVRGARVQMMEAVGAELAPTG